ncbi:MAG: hypothetical protein R3F59_31550 [Myxococcota bacterium]
MPLDAVLLGAQAALARGEALTALQRLQAATEPASSLGDPGRPACEALLADVEGRYGSVQVTVYVPKVPKLERAEAPFAPDEQAAIEEARKRIGKERRFLGLLPVGAYTLGDEAFAVAAGAPIATVRVGTPPISGSSHQE